MRMATTNPPASEADLKAFLEMAGRSLADAQGTLGGTKTDLVMANAELEAKVALRTDSTGKLSVQPISAQDLRTTQLNAAAVSTLRISFVATAPDPAAAPKPTRRPADVIDEIRVRPDIKALETILGPLTITSTYVPETARWMVTASDAKGRLVREFIVPDSAS